MLLSLIANERLGSIFSFEVCSATFDFVTIAFVD